ncbi:MAG: PspC domain-containing protein [Bacteroidales bacterium]
MEQNRLYRSRKNSVISGVCGGLGKHLNLDPVLVRVLFVITVILAGGGLLVYIVLWIVIPLEPENPSNANIFNDQSGKKEPDSSGVGHIQEAEDQKSAKSDGSLWGGLILIILGILFLAGRFIPRISFGDFWPVILIIIGVIIISKSKPSNKNL